MSAPDLPPPPDHGPLHNPLAVHLHPRLVTPDQLAGSITLVIDNLRASVTIAAALISGVHTIRPVLTVEDAQAHKARAMASQPDSLPPLLGGERGGRLVPGFDLDNSPASYTPHRCQGRHLIFTTTNGTAALLHAKHASLILVASLANLSAIAGAVAADPRPVHILCAGTRDEISLDDCLPAGALVQRLVARGRTPVQDDSARLCLRAWQEASSSPASLVAAMRDTRGGRNLVRIAMDADVDFCSRIDTLPVVPVFDPTTGHITRTDPRA